MTSMDALEQELCAGYAQEAQVYAEALDLAERATDDETPALVERLAALLGQIATLEDRLAPSKERWRLEAARPGKDLSARLEQVADLIRRLRDRLDQAMRHAVDRRSAVAAEVDSAVRREHGFRAYGAARMPPSRC